MKNSTQKEDRSELEVLTIEKARTLLHDQHNTVFDDYDPIFLFVTLHQGVIADYERMLKRHHLALTTMIGDAVSGLTEEAMSKNLDSHIELAERTNKAFEVQYKRARLLTIVCTIAAVICLPVLVYIIVT